MSDVEDRAVVVRIVALALSAVVVVPAVLLFGFLLLSSLPPGS